MRRLAFILCFFVGTAHAAEPSFPPLTGRVVDQANIISPEGEAALSDRLEAHERATSQQVVVATIPSLEGQAIEEYGVGLGRAWGIGEKGKNTGVILLVAPNDRQVRIEVGYGLEGQLTDALSRTIIEGAILPPFRAGQMEAGIAAGVTSMLAVLRGDEAATPKPIPPLQFDDDPSNNPFIVFVLVVLIYLFFRPRSRRLSRLAKVAGGTAAWLEHSSRSGRSSRGGGFGGGGGSFGGGGASGRW